MIDKLFLSIVITLLLGLFLNTNLLRGMPSQNVSAGQQDSLQTADLSFKTLDGAMQAVD